MMFHCSNVTCRLQASLCVRNVGSEYRESWLKGSNLVKHSSLCRCHTSHLTTRKYLHLKKKKYYNLILGAYKKYSLYILFNHLQTNPSWSHWHLWRRWGRALHSTVHSVCSVDIGKLLQSSISRYKARASIGVCPLHLNLRWFHF